MSNNKMISEMLHKVVRVLEENQDYIQDNNLGVTVLVNQKGVTRLVSTGTPVDRVMHLECLMSDKETFRSFLKFVVTNLLTKGKINQLPTVIEFLTDLVEINIEDLCDCSKCDDMSCPGRKIKAENSLNSPRNMRENPFSKGGSVDDLMGMFSSLLGGKRPQKEGPKPSDFGMSKKEYDEYMFGPSGPAPTHEMLKRYDNKNGDMFSIAEVVMGMLMSPRLIANMTDLDWAIVGDTVI